MYIGQEVKADWSQHQALTESLQLQKRETHNQAKTPETYEWCWYIPGGIDLQRKRRSEKIGQLKSNVSGNYNSIQTIARLTCSCTVNERES